MKNIAKRIIVAGVSLAFTFGALTACSNSADKDPEDITPVSTTQTIAGVEITKDEALANKLPDFIKTSGKLTIGTNPTYAPAQFIDEDGRTVVGYEVDVVRALGALLGVEVEFVQTEFANLIPGLGAKYNIGSSSITITPERAKQVDFVQIYTAGTAFAVAQGNPKGIAIPSESETALCGFSVGVQIGTTEEEDILPYVEKCDELGAEKLTVLPYESQSDITTAVVGGKIDATFADSPIVGYAIEQTNGQLEALGKDQDISPQGLIIKKGDTELANALSAGLNQLIKGGQYDEILESWGVVSGAVPSADVVTDLKDTDSAENVE